MSKDSNKKVEPQQATPLVHKVDSEPERISEVFHELLGLKSKFKKLKSFFRTRQCTIKGEYLFDSTSDEIKQKELMGPLTFNIYSSTIAGTVALGVTKLFSFIFPTKERSNFIPEDAVTAEFVKVLPQVEGFLHPFLVPMVFLIVAYYVSWGAIRESEPQFISISYESASKLPPSRRRGRNAFLYFDGAYGLIPQAVISLALTTIVSLTPNLLVPATGSGEQYPDFVISPLIWLGVVSLVLFLGAAIYQGYLTYYKFPKLLFRANGYYQNNDACTVASDESSTIPKPPWAKYILTALIVVPLTVLAIRLLYSAIVFVLSKFLAVVLTFLQGKL
jgi:hypothetical protein